jgi:hypothetical protein
MAEIPGQTERQVPGTDDERTARREGWRGFLNGLREAAQDPVRGQVIFSLGAALARDRQPGQSQSDFVSRAMSSANAAGGRAEEQQFSQQQKIGKAQREEQGLDLQRQEIESRENIAERREQGETERAAAANQTRKDVAGFQDASAQRRHEATLARMDRQILAQMRQHEMTLAQMDLNHEERMSRLNQIQQLEMQRKGIEAARRGKQDMVEVLKLASENAQTTDAYGAQTFDPRLFRNNVTLLGDILGVNVDMEADISRAYQAFGLFQKGNMTKEQAIARARASDLDPATSRLLMQLIEEGYSRVPEGGEPAAPQGAPRSEGSGAARTPEAVRQETEQFRTRQEDTRRAQELQGAVQEEQRGRNQEIGSKLTNYRARIRQRDMSEAEMYQMISDLEIDRRLALPPQQRMIDALIREAEALIRRK